MIQEIENRRSIRRFSDKPIPEDILVDILSSALCALLQKIGSHGGL